MTATTAATRETSAAAAARTVLVYRDDLLHLSESFVVEPLAHLTAYRPVLVATRTVNRYESDLPVRLVTRRWPGPEKLRVASYRLRGPGRRTIAELSTESPALVHAHFGVDAVQALPIARRLAIPLVTTCHGYEVHGDPADLERSFRGRRYLSRRADLAREGALFLAVSDYLRTRMLAQGFPPDRTRTHYIGVDTCVFHPAEQARSGILFVGRLIPNKGVHLLLRAAAQLPEPVDVTIAGDGPARAELQAMARDLGVRARFVGALPRAEVAERMACAAVLCLPTLIEAVGTVTLEAQAAGLPVVAHRVGGLPEAVVDGETGVLTEPGDVTELAAALHQVLSDDALRDRFGAAGRRHVEQRFDMHRQAAALERVYDEVTA